MNYKLVEDKNGTIVSKGKRYKMNKLEYTKDDLIDIQSDYDLLYKKLDHYNKIINTQALEIARIKEQMNTYENPDDLTLMFMWCDEKAKDKIKKLQQAKDKLQNDYQEARDRIDELISKIDNAIEYISNVLCDSKAMVRNDISGKEIDELLEILGDKENEY